MAMHRMTIAVVIASLAPLASVAARQTWTDADSRWEAPAV